MARVIEIRTQEKSRADQALADARRQLHLSGALLDAVKAAAAAAATAAAALQQAHDDLERQLAAATMPADQARLVTAIEDNLKQQRLANYQVGATQQAQTDAEQDQADLAALVAACQAASDSAQKGYDDAAAQEEQFASWRAALGATATLQALSSAQDAKTVDPYKKAKARLEGLLTPELVDLYRQRAWFAAENAAQAQIKETDALEGAALARQTGEPLASARLSAAAALGTAINNVQDAAEGSVTRYANAVKALTEIGGRVDDTADDPLKSILARMNDRAGAAKAAAAKEKDLFDKTRAVDDAEAAYEKVKVELLGENPDADPETDNATKADFDALTAARTALEGAETAYDGVKGDLDNWEVTVPPDIFADVVSFLDAEMAIDTVAGVNPGNLKTALDTAEGAYAAAEVADVAYRRGVAMADAEVASMQRRMVASAGAAAAHKLMTIRGDR